jgi:8-oxo-dGTP diphosphatase
VSAHPEIKEVDWESWTPKERATLLFVTTADQILLIQKKRGIGAGKINGPGGRLDPGETPMACAIREVQEELGIRALGVREAGELRFQFADGFSMLVYVFRADRFAGTPRETDEAVPRWTRLDEIPFDRMWADDRVWMPLMLRNIRFDGRFIFDGDELLAYAIRSDGATAASGRGPAKPSTRLVPD